MLKMKKVLFLCGYACESWIWNEVVEELQDNFTIQNIDWPINKCTQFDSLKDFAVWIDKNIDDNIDYIIGHSMGGLVALHLANMRSHTIQKVILVETFITSPSDFFKNLVTDKTPDELKYRLNTMMSNNKSNYSKKLLKELIDVNVLNLIQNINSKLYVINGDRGCGDTKKIINELNWPNSVKEKVDLHIVHNSCHFPMLENKKELVKILFTIL
ncbi:alpha/beta fold hydrolase [Clostridiaceae bacterium M8S5]|nr:alpha/beta fold hydrolase [Clostridiaceae bacterium M8S5]